MLVFLEEARPSRLTDIVSGDTSVPCLEKVESKRHVIYGAGVGLDSCRRLSA